MSKLDKYIKLGTDPLEKSEISNVFNTHRLGLVKNYEKINKGELGVGRSNGALLF